MPSSFTVESVWFFFWIHLAGDARPLSWDRQTGRGERGMIEIDASWASILPVGGDEKVGGLGA